MKRLALVSLASLSLLYCSSKPSLAFTTRTVFSEQAQGIEGKPVDLEVWPGYPLTINFLKTQEVIKDVLLGDPSHFVYGAMAGSLCAMESDREGCNNTGSKVIYIRQIDPPINFPNLPHSPDGSTQLKLITEGPEGQKEYQFKIIPAKKGLPTYTSLKIRPDSEKAKPTLLNPNNREREISLLEQYNKSNKVNYLQKNQKSSNELIVPKNRQNLIFINQFRDIETSQIKKYITVEQTELDEPNGAIATPRKTISSPTKTKLISQSKISYSPQSISDANAIVRGLVLAKQKGEIEYHSRIWLQTQHAIIVLRQGKTIPEAAKSANLPEDLLKQLSILGQVRPLSSIAVAIKPSHSIQKVNTTNSLNNIDLAVQGLSIAVKKRQIIPFTTDWLKARKAIALLAQGRNKLEAANEANLSLLELQNLINLGR